ncbi:hypothetical protein JHK87_041819 [Glycine soja]|nr:hypothetical protein JHK87_041819 [Glycine soja]
MATTDLENKSSTPPPPPADVNYSKVDVILRILLLAASVEVLAVIVSGDQTEQLLFQDVLVPQPAKYFVAACSVSGLYALVSALASISVIQKPEFKLKFLLHFIFWDAGNSRVDWIKVCNVYDKFCRHLAGSIAVALLYCDRPSHLAFSFHHSQSSSQIDGRNMDHSA